MLLGRTVNRAARQRVSTGERRRSRWREATLLPGDWVEVLPASQIVRTLDADQALDGLPFMPEMLPYCGQRYRVALRAERTCVHPPEHPFRRLQDTVVLRGLRCDGVLHGGCELGCMFLWKDVWLRRVPPGGREEAAAHADGVPALRASPVSGGARFFCQATELPRATARGIPIWKPGQYLRFLKVRTLSLGELVAMFGRPVLRRARWFVASLVPGGAAPPTAIETTLGLQPGEWVEIRSRDEILQTLDAEGCLRGLYFTADMYEHCGKRMQVWHRVQHVIVERTGALQQVRDTVTLEGSICDRYRGCARELPILWREAWLKRTDQIPENTAPEPSAP